MVLRAVIVAGKVPKRKSGAEVEGAKYCRLSTPDLYLPELEQIRPLPARSAGRDKFDSASTGKDLF